MTSWDAFAIAILIQVTAITLVAAVLLRLLQRSAAQRHAVALVSLLLILLSPALVLVLPQSHWPGLKNGSGVELSESGQPADLSSAENLRRSDIGIVTEPLMIQSESDSAGTSAADGSLASKSADEPIEALSANTGLADSAGAAGEPSRFDDSDLVSAGTPQTSSTLLSLHWSQRALRVVLCVWGVGMLIPVIRLWRARRSLRPLLETLEPVPLDERLQSIGEYVLQYTGLSRLPVISSSTALPTPAVLGLWHPIVVLPAELLRDGSDQQLRDVLIHECAHIVRRDPWILALQKLAGILWWLHPGVIWLNRQLQRAREEVCDNYVLRQAEPTDYAQTLLQLTERSAAYRPALSLLGLFAQRWTLEARVTGLLDPRRQPARRAGRACIAALIAILGSICFAAGGVAQVGQSTERSVLRSNDGKSVEVPLQVNDDSQIAKSSRAKKITIRGVCHDDKSQPLAGVTIRVFRYHSRDSPPLLAAETKTDETGQFVFNEVGTTDDPSRFSGSLNVVVTASATGYSSAYRWLHRETQAKDIAFKLSSDTGTLAGIVKDFRGRPVKAARVYVHTAFGQPIPGITSALTDRFGRFSVADLRYWWDDRNAKKANPVRKGVTAVSRRTFRIQHPDFATTLAVYTAVPQHVEVTLQQPAIVEGAVVDLVTGSPIANALIAAQGVVRSESFQTRADQDGRYRLRMTADHYNIWADVPARMPIAVKAIKAESGKTTSGADIQMTRGGFVIGTVIDSETGQPVSRSKAFKLNVAHYGPARPRTGAAVTSTQVKPDGTYRLHVAPGRNYIYLRRGEAAPAWVTVGDGQATKHDIVIGSESRSAPQADDPDVRHRKRLHLQAEREDAQISISDLAGDAATEPIEIRAHKDTLTGTLLELLVIQNSASNPYNDAWAATLRNIAQIGSPAVPELIEELDATDDPMMLSCLAFVLRAIDDKRAVPALIRAVPRVMWAKSSSMRLTCQDDELAAFLQEHDVYDENRGNSWSLGHPTLEVLKALQALTGQDYHRDRLYHIRPGGFPDQDAAREKLFYRAAKQWSDWWEMHWSEFVNDAQYSRVSLPDLVPREPTYPISATKRLSFARHRTRMMLESVHDPIAWGPFYDLDTGRSAHLPERWKNKPLTEDDMHWILKWATSEGFDLVGDEYVSPDGRRTLALRMIGLNAWEFDEKRWAEHAKETTLQKLQDEGRRTEGWLLHFNDSDKEVDPAATASFLFITREGTPGVIHVDPGHQSKRNRDEPHASESSADRARIREGRRFSIDRLAPAS